MNRTLFTYVAIVGILLASFTACSNRDKIVSVADDYAEMIAAIAKARETLPQFWNVFEKRERGETDFSLKVRITDKSKVEHFWVSDIERSDHKITGVINNDADTVSTVKLGDKIVIPEADISDWLYMRDGKMVGNRTVKPLFKKMPKEEVEKMKKMMASDD